jgi:hypothetical protein
MRFQAEGERANPRRNPLGGHRLRLWMLEVSAGDKQLPVVGFAVEWSVASFGRWTDGELPTTDAGMATSLMQALLHKYKNTGSCPCSISSPG